MPGERLDMRDAPGCKLEQCFTAGAHRGAHAGGDAKQNSRVCLCIRKKKKKSWRHNCDELTQTAFVWHPTPSNVYFQEITQVLAAAILMGNSRANTDVDHDNHQGSIRLLRRREKAWREMDQKIHWLKVWGEVNLLFAVGVTATNKPPSQTNEDNKSDFNMHCKKQNLHVFLCLFGCFCFCWEKKQHFLGKFWSIKRAMFFFFFEESQ